jgi:hypothetical protein
MMRAAALNRASVNRNGRGRNCRIRNDRQLLRRPGVDPVSRIGSYCSEVIMRLGLIEIARIKAKAVGRSQFPVEDMTYLKAAIIPTRDWNGSSRNRGCRNGSGGWRGNGCNARRRNGSGWDRFGPNARRNGSGCEGKCENASGSLMSPRPTYVAPRRHVRPGECAAGREHGRAERQGGGTCEYRLTEHVLDRFSSTYSLKLTPRSESQVQV